MLLRRTWHANPLVDIEWKVSVEKKVHYICIVRHRIFFQIVFSWWWWEQGAWWISYLYISEQTRIVLLFISCSNCYLQLSSLFLKVDTEGFRSYQVPLSYLSSTSQTTYLSTNYQLPDLITFRYFNATFYILQLQTV